MTFKTDRARLAHATTVFMTEYRCDDRYTGPMDEALQADDLWRLNHPTPAGDMKTPTVEPTLPKGVTFYNKDGWGPLYEKFTCPEVERIFISKYCFSPNELRAIAAHMSWRESQQRQAEPAVTESLTFTADMARDVFAEWQKPKPNGEHTFSCLANLIQAALAAAPSKPEARQGREGI